MRYAYASFGTPTKQSLLDFTDRCYAAGRDWALTGHVKLPKIGVADGQEFPVVRSSSLQAIFFVKGWKDAGKGTMVAQFCPLP